MSSELQKAAYSVLLPAFGDLILDENVRRFLSRGGVSILLGETREEYVSRHMSPSRKRLESQGAVVDVIQQAVSLAGAPVLVAVDQELGGIERLHQLVPPVASREALNGLASEEIERRCFKMASVARSLGVNLFLAPIVDVVTGVNPWLHDRHLGADPKEVSRVSCAFIRGVQRAGVVATAKHFPGHYVTEQDPAVALATVPGPLALLQDNIGVFKDVIATGVKAVMPGPAVFPAIDPEHSASTSPKVISMLRDTLGFEGLIISDDLDAVSILRGNAITDTAVASLAAGAHLLLVSSESGLDAIAEAIVTAVQDGRLDRQLLLAAAARVRELAAANHDSYNTNRG
jgi:beta-N-acetylhexosaminidase